MSRYIATRAMRGATALVTEAEMMLDKAMVDKGGDTKVEFPNTAYYLPLIYGMTGEAVETLDQLKPVVERARSLLHPLPSQQHWTPYLGETLDSGMATLLAAETMFPWTSSLILGKAIYNLRNVQHHVSEMSLELTRRGYQSPEWQ